MNRKEAINKRHVIGDVCAARSWCVFCSSSSVCFLVVLFFSHCCVWFFGFLYYSSTNSWTCREVFVFLHSKISSPPLRWFLTLLLLLLWRAWHTVSALTKMTVGGKVSPYFFFFFFTLPLSPTPSFLSWSLHLLASQFLPWFCALPPMYFLLGMCINRSCVHFGFV